MSKYKIGDYDIEQVQSVMLEIASEIDRVCRLHGIRYTLEGGTLIGAIRHQGFIPWDDDLDVSMLREDYDRFVEACKTDLDECFFLETCEVEADYPFDFAKVKKNGTVYVEKDNKYRNVNQGVYVDVFPIDNIHLCTFRLQSGLYSLVRRARWRKIDKRILPKEEWKKHRMRKITRIAIPLTVFSEKALAKWDKKIMTLHNRKNTGYVFKVCHPNKIKPPYPRTLYTELTEVPFEGKLFFVPAAYDEYLRARYGDYMKLPDEEQQHPTHGIIEIRL